MGTVYSSWSLSSFVAFRVLAERDIEVEAEDPRRFDSYGPHSESEVVVDILESGRSKVIMIICAEI
jgi:hypothetical protein